MDHADWTIQGHHGALRKGRIASQAGLTRRAHCELRTEIASHWGCGILSALFGFPHATPLFSNDIGLCSPEECIIDARTLPLHRRFFSGHEGRARDTPPFCAPAGPFPCSTRCDPAVSYSPPRARCVQWWSPQCVAELLCAELVPAT